MLNPALVGALVLAVAPAQSPAERLVGLARAWGQVKYVHPAMVTSGIDWDAALLRATPAVEIARTTREYREAIDALLDGLDDPVTRVVDDEPSTPPDIGPAQAEMGLQPIDARTAMLTIPSGPGLESTPELRALLCSRFEEATTFERLVIDLRSPSGEPAGWNLADAIVKCSARLLSHDVALPPARFLRHGFYMMQSVTGGPGGGLGSWSSGLEEVASGSLRREGPRTPRLVVIVERARSTSTRC